MSVLISAILLISAFAFSISATGNEAELTVGTEKTEYATLGEAVTAANGISGAKIKLLCYIT